MDARRSLLQPLGHWLRSVGRPALLYLGAIALVGFAIDGGVYSVLFNLFLLRLGYGTEQIGLINAAAQLTFAVSALPAGGLGARFGTRRMLLLGLALMLAGCALLPIADVIPAGARLAWMLAMVAMLYFGIALYYVNTAPFLLGMIAPSERNHMFGLQSALLAVAAFGGGIAGGLFPPFFASLLGVSLDEPAPYRYALLLASLALLPAIIAIRATPREEAQPAETPGQAASSSSPEITIPSAVMAAIVMMGLVRLLQVGAIAAVNSFFNVYLDRGLGIGTAQIGTITAFGRLLGAPAALATSRLTRRFGNRSVVAWSTLGSALALAPIALVPHWAAAALTLVCIVSMSSIRYASSLVYFLELVPPQRRATVSGMTEMAGGLSFTIMALLGGYLISWYGYPSLFVLGALVTALGGLVFTFYFRRFSR
jgi:MFS family permease